MSVIVDDTAGQGSLDRRRYQDKIRDRVKAILPDLAGNVPVLTGDGSDAISITVPDGDLELPRYRPALPKAPLPGVGQGDGQPGDIVGIMPKSSPGRNASQPGTADAPHPVVVDMTLEELRALIVEDLALPPLPPKPIGTEGDPAVRWTSRARHGTRSQVDARFSLKQAILRSQAQQVPVGFIPEDLRYRTWTESLRPVTQAAVYLLRDASGSMDEDKRYLSQMAAWRVVSGLQRHYDHLETRFWIHDATGEETDETAFYQSQNFGGTAFAPVYAQIREDMNRRYPQEAWNRIVIQFSDGDCWDAEAAEILLADWLPSLHFFGFVLTDQGRHGMSVAHHWADRLPETFAVVRVIRRADVVPALRRLMEGGERRALNA